ncbi:TIGR03089 family protein [Janibacter sp. G1551]|uniref:TIGR03089 family protein n=1 Tax=Janibacter sp. G1551 TaxID=3420440 RepID=UPI003D042757
MSAYLPLATLLRSDAARPRVTCYDDVEGPTRGERIELSARVLGNWVSKAANALQDDWDAEPGTVVRIAAEPHWRPLYWALAAWSVGACVALDDGPCDVLVTDDPALLDGRPGGGILLTRASLARAATVPVPEGAMDEAKELSTHPDQFAAWAEPEDDDPAFRTDDGTQTWGGSPAGPAVAPGARILLDDPDLETLLRAALAAWGVDGSIVLGAGPLAPEAVAARAATEGAVLLAD